MGKGVSNDNRHSDPSGRSTIEEYRHHASRNRLTIIALAALAAIASLVAVGAGSTDLNARTIAETILGTGTHLSSVVVWNIRLPRVIAAIVVGSGLSLAGLVMQNNLRNSMASASTIGVSHAAAFGANIAIIILGASNVRIGLSGPASILHQWIVPLSAFAWSTTATVLVVLLTRFRRFSPPAVVLAGVALGSLFNAGMIVIQYFAEDVEIASVVFWTFGDLGRSTWRENCIMGALTIIGSIYFFLHRWDYNAIDAGEEVAQSLGVPVDRIRMEGMAGSSLIAAVSVSFIGMIGFVGLVGPQIARRLIGPDFRFLLPGSALVGAILLLVADSVARTIISPVVLPVGAITSFLGAPLFLYLLVREPDAR